MAYTFGAGTGDDITWTSPLGVGNDNATNLVIGWFYPTTLTSGRGLWSVATGGIVSCYINSTTSELNVRSNNVTDGVWVTSGAGITTNKWWCIAVAGAFENTGPTVQYRVWIGDAETPPQLATLNTTTSPSGNNTGNTAFYVGNLGTGTTAFQGDIGPVSVLGINGSTLLSGGWPTNAATGVIDTDATENIRQRFVLPWWEGRPNAQFLTHETASWQFSHWDSMGGLVRNRNNLATAVPITATISGATLSENAPPRSPPADWVERNGFVRRAA